MHSFAEDEYVAVLPPAVVTADARSPLERLAAEPTPATSSEHCGTQHAIRTGSGGTHARRRGSGSGVRFVLKVVAWALAPLVRRSRLMDDTDPYER